ncbi:MAG: hypothetical protein OXR68_05505 [Alphaproteobacteria bacterium]|nr:hypothetical protein [Alphaproteobacteria bacterium]MDD9920060.1 hypothetical protein [Alphaproteobacteria bacterium]
MFKYMANTQRKVANWLQDKRVMLAKTLAGDAFAMTPKDNVRLAGCVVFWYEQEGYRHYITVQAKTTAQTDNLVRFPSFFGLLPTKDAAETMRSSVEVQLGQAFLEALENKSISTDTIAAVPTFRWHDKSLGTVDVVQLLVWEMQLTPEQVAHIETNDLFSVQHVPEFGMSGKRVSEAHKLIYKSVQNRIQNKAKPVMLPTQILEQLDDLLDEAVEFNSGNRTIH